VITGQLPATGLYTAFVALFFYSVLASSRHQKVTTSSTMAVMSLAVVTPVALGNPAVFAVASSMLALIVGACIASVNVLANAAGDSFDDSSTHLQSVLGS
jgi:MFS superfamily sulfate permease-like transporter